MEAGKQLNLFSEVESTEKDTAHDYDKILYDKAEQLLEMLNDGRKKLRYAKQFWYQEGNYVVMIVANEAKDMLFNILDVWGNLPQNCSANWRTLQHIQQDLKELAS